MPTSLPFTAAPDGVRLAVRLTPRASADRIIGLAGDADGNAVLKIAVTAAPEAGKANDALLRLLARLLRLPRWQFSVTLGAGARRKLVHIGGEPATLSRRLEEVLGQWLKRD
ncbi:MAG TPA: DUF167 family protein [Stellaceae bacterium]|nr:DUF167 family protein [Stellaceae bacterium]